MGSHKVEEKLAIGYIYTAMVWSPKEALKISWWMLTNYRPQIQLLVSVCFLVLLLLICMRLRRSWKRYGKLDQSQSQKQEESIGDHVWWNGDYWVRRIEVALISFVSLDPKLNKEKEKENTFQKQIQINHICPQISAFNIWSRARNWEQLSSKPTH